MDARVTSRNEVLIVGAGPVGAVCALALQQQGITAQVLEAQAADARADTRILALSHGSRLILERLGVWDRLDGQTSLQFDMDAAPAVRVTEEGVAELRAAAEGDTPEDMGSRSRGRKRGRGSHVSPAESVHAPS